MDIDYTDCDSFVPFSDYDWTFERKGWLKWKSVSPAPITTLRTHADSAQSHSILPHRLLLRRRILDVSRTPRARLRNL
jgi:hypothetical protein